MILSAHIIVGAGVGIATNDPYAGMATAIASHYVLDVIPHREYSVSRLKTGSTQAFIEDLSKVALDFIAGFTAVALLASGNILALAFGFLGALPDATSFLCILLERRGRTKARSIFLRGLFRHLAFHHYIHTIFMKKETKWRTAIVTQATAIMIGAWMLLYFL